MEPSDLLVLVASEFERMGIEYFVTGSMATIYFGEPRMTNDVDVVVRLELNNLPNFSAAFPAEEFYCSAQMIESAVRNRKQFNVIHPASGLKADIIVSDQSAFDSSRFSRRIRREVEKGKEAWFASPEDVILKKLVYYKEGGSEKHIRDILGVLKIQGNSIDLDYLAHWAAQLGLLDLWQNVLAQSQ
jgi:hypothetical protein